MKFISPFYGDEAKVELSPAILNDALIQAFGLNATTKVTGSGASETKSKDRLRVRQAIIITLMTRLGARFMLPSFGAGLNENIFKNDSRIGRVVIQKEAISALDRWVPTIANVVVRADVQDKKEQTFNYILSVAYDIPSLNVTNDSFVFPFYGTQRGF